MSDALDPRDIVKPEGLALCILIVTIFFTCISLGVVGLRVCVRIKTRALGNDDGLMIAGTLINTAHNGAVVFGVFEGIGTLDSKLNTSLMMEGAKAIFIWQILYVSGSAFIKASICTQLIRIAEKKWQKYCLQGLIVLSFVITFMAIGVVLIRCKPIPASWNPALGTCASPKTIIVFTWVVSIMNIITDFSVAIIPVFILWGLQMQKKLKIMAYLVLGIGFLASIATIIRLPYSSAYSKPKDILHGVGFLILWTVVECSLGIIAGSMPMLRQLVKGLSKDKSSSASVSNNIGLVTFGRVRDRRAHNLDHVVVVVDDDQFSSNGDSESTKEMIDQRKERSEG